MARAPSYSVGIFHPCSWCYVSSRVSRQTLMSASTNRLTASKVPPCYSRQMSISSSLPTCGTNFH